LQEGARAVEDGHLSRNVAHVRRAPKVEDGPDSDRDILQPDRVKAVLDALKGHTLFPVVALALFRRPVANCSP
jgi:hypothetical protein